MDPNRFRVLRRFLAARGQRIDPTMLIQDLTARTSKDVLELRALGADLSQLGLGDQARDVSKCVRILDEVRKELSAEAGYLRRNQNPDARLAGRNSKKQRTRHRVIDIPLARSKRPAPSFNKMEPAEVLGYLRWLLLDYLEMEGAEAPLQELGRTISQGMKLVRREQRFRRG